MSDDVSLRDHVKEILIERDKALDAALVSINERLKLLNELRAGVATVAQLEALDKVVDDLAARLTRAEGQTQGASLNMGKIYAVIAAVGTIITIIVLIASRL